RDISQQHAFARAPSRGRDVGRTWHCEQDKAKHKPPDRPGFFSKTLARQLMVAFDTHLCPPKRDIVTHDKWKARYNLRLAIGYRDTGTANSAPASEITGTSPSARRFRSDC